MRAREGIWGSKTLASRRVEAALAPNAHSWVARLEKSG